MGESSIGDLSLGMYILATNTQDKNVGCVVNTVVQVSSSPVCVAFSLSRKNFTTNAILKSGKFTISVLSEKINMDVLTTFGFISSREKDKFDFVKFKILGSDLPVLSEGISSFLECELISETPCFDYTLIVARVIGTTRVSSEKPLTYAYYCDVIKGRTSKNSPTYAGSLESSQKEFVCNVCGYTYPGEPKDFKDLPDFFKCPICAMPKDGFSLVTATSAI